MTSKRLWLGILLISLQALPAFSFTLSPEFVLRNNVAHRKYLRRMAVRQQININNDLSCKETIYFVTHNNIRIDYDCENEPYTLFIVNHERTALYNQTIVQLEERPIHFLISLFLYRDGDVLIQSIGDHQFVEVEEIEDEILALESSLGNKKTGEDETLLSETEPKPEDSKEDSEKETPEEPKEPEWRVKGHVKLVRLEKIEKGTPDKMEKNVSLLLSPPQTDDSQPKRKIWFEKDIFLPQKIQHGKTEFVFLNYKEITNNHPKYPRFFRYPQKIEIRKDGSVIVKISPLLDETEINPKFESGFFQAAKVLQKQKLKKETTEISGSKRATLEQFIRDFR